jgi:hypothetical protein
VNGTYLVLVASFDSGFKRDGKLSTHDDAHARSDHRLPQRPRGPLTNGATATGEILRGDVDVWTFDATMGDRIGVHVGQIIDNDDFRRGSVSGPPNGAVLGDTPASTPLLWTSPQM